MNVLRDIHGIICSLLSEDVYITNKELLKLLDLNKRTIRCSKNNEEHKHTYYAILSNQAEMVGRDGEMLYHAKK